MADVYDKYMRTLDMPAEDAVAITPHDSTDLANVTRGVWVGGAGNVAAVMKLGTVVTFVGVPAGTLLPIRVSRINATNTTATSLVGLV